MIDNYDSFVYNLVRYFEELCEEILVYRNDKISLEDILMEAEGVFITNSVMGIMQVSKIQDKFINESMVVSEIKRYYDSYVENYKEEGAGK